MYDGILFWEKGGCHTASSYRLLRLAKIHLIHFWPEGAYKQRDYELANYNNTIQSNYRSGRTAALHCCWSQLLYCRYTKLYWTCRRISPAKTFNWKFPHSVSANIFVSCNQARAVLLGFKKWKLLFIKYLILVKLSFSLLIVTLTWWLRWTSPSCWYWQHCKCQSVRYKSNTLISDQFCWSFQLFASHGECEAAGCVDAVCHALHIPGRYSSLLLSGWTELNL